MWEIFGDSLGRYFAPHVYSLRGDHPNVWFLVASDLSIALAHFAIVLVLLLVVFKKKDRLFLKVVLLFALFIGFRGITQLLALWTIWNPQYQLGEAIRTCSTVLSVTTAFVLVRLLPVLHRLPTVAELEKEIAERQRAELAECEKEERFRNFVESVQDYAIYVIDTEGVVQTWNLGAERMKGYSAEEIIGQNFSRFYTSEDQAEGKPQQTLQKVIETGRSEGEVWRVRKDGTRFLANVILRPLFDPSGKLAGFSKITRDLTESREMESKYRMLLEAVPDAIVILGSGGAIEFINTRAETLFGYSRAEVMGESVDILVPLRNRDAQAIYRDRLFKQASHPLSGAPAEILGLRKDGSDFPLEFSLSSLDTQNGRVLLFVIRDLTERHKTEARFQALLESAPDAMVIVDATGRIELANEQTERLFGYPRADLMGKSVELLMPVHVRGTHDLHLQSFFKFPKRRELGVGLNLMAERKDGSRFPVEISLSPLEGPEGVLVTAAIRDVTERRKAAELLADKLDELRHSNDELEQFAHIASHDLQEPLRMVASYTQLLTKRYKGRLDADADEFIAYAVDGTQRMKRLIEDLLVYSRVGKGVPAAREFRSEDALREALANLASRIDESGALITYDPLPAITAVYAQVVQVFQNLIANAIKYCADHVPRIHISSSSNAAEWVFSVADNGIGIAPEYFERIFVIFQRLHGREEFEGTGIGLAICKRILMQQGGRIWVESEPGRGSTFSFVLPVEK